MSFENIFNKWHANKSSATLHPRQSMALAYYKKHGLPSRSDENWRYTNLKSIESGNFLPSTRTEGNINLSVVEQIKSRLNSEFYNLVFINGHLNNQLSHEFIDFIQHNQKHINLTVNQGQSDNIVDTIDALNTMFFDQQLNIDFAKNSSISKPLCLFFFNQSEESSQIMASPRINIKIGDYSNLSLVEHYEGTKESNYFTNSDIKITMGESSNLTYIHSQCESSKATHFSRTSIIQGKSSNLVALSYSDGSQLSRHTLTLDLNQEYSTAKILGAYLVTNSQQSDHYTSINHNVGHCKTEQLYKGILDGNSRAVFNGRVFIQKDAQKANSEQLNKNLLLSSKAEIDTKPQLEIFADDVKATHGATIGQLNQDELFYLQSRAISKQQALAMLAIGFVSDVVEKIENNNIRIWLENRIVHTLEQYKIEL